MTAKITIKQKIYLIIFGVFLCFILLETGLRIAGYILLSVQEHKNRIVIKQKGTYRIMCIGESTTFCGKEYSYPSQLEKILNNSNLGIRFSVINKGIPGTDSGVIISQLEDNLNKYNPDMIIAMMGINDSFDTSPYYNVSSENFRSFCASFRTYKLIKLLWFRSLNNTKKYSIDILSLTRTEPGIDKYKNEKEKIRSKDDKDYIYIGRVYMNKGNYREAEKMFRKAMRIEPGDSETYRELGQNYLHKGDLVAAEEMFRKAVEINPENAAGYIGIGECFRTKQKYNTAEEMFKEAIKIKSNIWAYINLGYCYIQQRKYIEAEQMYKKAIQENPKNRNLYGGLISYYWKKKDYKSADKYLKQMKVLKSEYYSQATKKNYNKLTQATEKRIKLVCVQYPLRDIESLKKIVGTRKDIIFVDNEPIFKKALKYKGYDEYFVDSFAGDFGHCTVEGNRLLAENIANGILKEVK